MSLTPPQQPPQGWQPPSNQQPEPKKPFFKSTGGIIAIAGSILLALILVIALIVNIVRPGGRENASATGTSESSVSASASASSSAADEKDSLFNEARPSASSSSGSKSSSSPSASASRSARPPVDLAENPTPKEIPGDFTEYTGTGDQTVDVELPAGSTAGYMVYTLKADQGNGYIAIEGEDAAGEAVDDVHFAIFNDHVQGSSFISGEYEGSRAPVDKLRLRANGEWSIRIYDVSSTPVYYPGETIRSTGPQVFYYQGPGSTADIRYNVADASLYKYSGFTIRYFDSDNLEGSLITLITDNSYQSSETFPETDVAIMMVGNTAGEWSIRF